MRTRLLSHLGLACGLLVLGLPAFATPYWGPDEIGKWLREHPTGPGTCEPSPALSLPSEGARSHPDYALQLTREAAFLNAWQVHTAGADFGGIREAEHLPNIIQTDNTSEAIWVWTRYFELTGNDQYHQNILDAFTYSMSHQAYNEEGGSLPTTGYYRMYNCGWAAKAELKYRSVYGDYTYKSYGDSCASYIRYHTLIRDGNSFDDYVNPPVLSWALGNLYDVGAQQSNEAWMGAAVEQARDAVKVWVEGEPTLLGNETWAMSGGATMWGFVHSYLAAVPESVTTWIPRYAGYLDTYSSPGSFQNAWNGWYSLGHRAVGLALNDPYELGLHVALTDTLVAEDGDFDGGIPARPQDTDTMDQTWVSNYLSVFGLSEFIAPAAGVLADAIGPEPLRLDTEPNPFASSTLIRWNLQPAGGADLGVYDVAGRRVASPSVASALGGLSARWDGRGGDGARLPGGIYFVRLRTAGGTASTRLVYLP